MGRVRAGETCYGRECRTKVGDLTIPVDEAATELAITIITGLEITLAFATGGALGVGSVFSQMAERIALATVIAN